MKHRQKQCDEEQDESEDQKLLVLPYLQGLSEKITRICSKLNIRTAFKSCH